MKGQETLARELGMIFPLVMLAAVLPAWQAPVGFLVGLQFFRSLLIAYQKRAWHGLEWRGPLPWMALFYLWHLAGMAWSTDQDFGWMDMGMKASLLVFPLIGMLTPKPGGDGLRRVFIVFAVSGAVVSMILLLRASWLFAGEWWAVHQGAPPQGMPWTNHFFSSYYSPEIHPSYLSWYLAMGLLGWSASGAAQRHARWNIPVITALGVGVLLTASKMGWLVFALVLGHMVWHHRRERVVYRPLFRFLLAGMVAFMALVAGVRTLRMKVVEAVQAAKGTQTNAEDSSALRVQVWDVALELAAAHPLIGTGTGDVKNELVAGYERKGYLHALEKRLNAHSQYLQSLVALGVPGLLLLLGCTLWPLIQAMQKGDGPLAVFLLSAVLNFSVESMLEVQAGIVFFAWYGIMLTWLGRSEGMRGPAR
ncbi:MAG: O-antigen ligase family protein [Flavobacteriales bacterium]|nr:O-antigen ligase family protein [Flavobacteriales bacterium]